MLPLFLLVCVTSSLAAPVTITNSWNGGFQGSFTVHADHAVHGWKAHLTFDKPVSSLEVISGVTTTIFPFIKVRYSSPFSVTCKDIIKKLLSEKI